MAHLAVTLAVGPRGVLVTWRLDGVTLAAGEPLGRLPVAVAGAPTLRLEDVLVKAADEVGTVPLVLGPSEGADGEAARCWSVGRATSGPVEFSYLAEPVTEEPRPATPPLELRRGRRRALRSSHVLPGPPSRTGRPHLRAALGATSGGRPGHRHLDGRLQPG